MYYQFIITLNFFIKNQTLQKNTLSKIETLKKKPYKKKIPWVFYLFPKFLT